MPRVGIEPTLPVRAAALQAARRPTARPKAIAAPLAGFEPAASTLTEWRALLAAPQGLLSQSTWRGSNPHRRLGTPACLPFTPQVLRPEHPAGIEPASPPWEDGMFPLHHGCTSRGDRTRTCSGWISSSRAAAYTTPLSISRRSGSRTHTRRYPKPVAYRQAFPPRS